MLLRKLIQKRTTNLSFWTQRIRIRKSQNIKMKMLRRQIILKFSISETRASKEATLRRKV